MSEGTGLKLDELRAQRAQLRANMKQVEQEMNSSNENGSGSHSGHVRPNVSASGIGGDLEEGVRLEDGTLRVGIITQYLQSPGQW